MLSKRFLEWFNSKRQSTYACPQTVYLSFDFDQVIEVKIKFNAATSSLLFQTSAPSTCAFKFISYCIILTVQGLINAENNQMGKVNKKDKVAYQNCYL